MGGQHFSFVLPFEVSEAAPVPTVERRVSGLRVMVVDDNPTTYMLLEEMLANWSAEVTVVNRGKNVRTPAERALRDRPFDVVVLDHSLPMRHRGAAARHPARPGARNAYVVLLSALDFDAHYEGTKVMHRTFASASRCASSSCAPHCGPRAGRAALTVSAPAAEARRRPSARSRQPRLHVLVVDDNAINREVSLAMLEELGCSVVLRGWPPGVTSAQHTVRRDLHGLPDAGMDGYAATEAIRPTRHSAAGPAPSSRSPPRHSRDAIAARRGMTGFLANPSRPCSCSRCYADR